MTTLDAPAVPPLTAYRLLVAIGNEVVKGLRHAWAERVQILMELPFFTAFVFLYAMILGRGGQFAAGGRLTWHVDSRTVTWMYLGFTLFTFVYLSSVKTFWRLLAEIQTGTLEQSYLSPMPAWLSVAVGRVVAAIAETAIVVGTMSIVVGLVTDLRITWRTEALAPLALVVVGGVGYTLMIAGFTLVWKRVEILQEMITGILMFVSGAILPMSHLPGWFSDVAKPMFLTHPIVAARTTLLYGRSIPTWGIGGWVWLTATAGIWLALGLLIYNVSNRAAERAGTLNRY